MKRKNPEFAGHLDIDVDNREDEFEGAIQKWPEVLIYGDPDGLRSFAKFLIKVANINQDNLKNLPFGEREHLHIWDISKSSVPVIVGRLDAKGTGLFPKRYVAKDTNKK